jgi:hypothetical protein
MFLVPAVVAVAVCFAMLTAIVLLARGERDSTPASPRLGGARRACRLAGIAVGAVAVWLVGGLGTVGEGSLLAGPVFGLCVLAGVLLGELLAPRPGGPVRVAGLRVRRFWDFAPRRGGVAAALATGALLALSFAGTATATDSGDATGRVLTVTCSDETFPSSPYPGWFYTHTALLALVIGLVATLVVLRRIARSPWPIDEAADAAESALRRRSAEAAVAGYGVLVVTMVAGFAGTAFGIIMNVGCPGAASLNVAATAFGFALLFALLCFVVYLVRLAAPPTWSQS